MLLYYTKQGKIGEKNDMENSPLNPNPIIDSDLRKRTEKKFKRSQCKLDKATIQNGGKFSYCDTLADNSTPQTASWEDWESTDSDNGRCMIFYLVGNYIIFIL